MRSRYYLLPLLWLATLPALLTAAAPGEEAPAPEVHQAHDVIHRVYREVLGRDADSAGLNTYTRHLIEEGRDETWLRSVLGASPEKKSSRATMIKRWRPLLAGLGAGLGLLIYGAACRRKPALARFTLKCLFMFLFTFGLGEAVLRLYQYARPGYFFYDSSYNRYRGRPHATDWDFSLNDRGFKDVAFTAKTAGVYRILGLGDSFAFGVVPYRYHYYTLLEDELQQRGYNAEVLNMGIPSIGPADYRNLLVAEGLDLSPDMVIVSFFVGNDFTDSMIAQKRRKWFEYTYVTTVLYYLTQVRPEYAGRRDNAHVYDDETFTFSEVAFNKIQRTRSYIYRRNDERFPVHFKAAIRYMDDIQAICRRRNIALFVAIIPDETQINPELQGMIKRRIPEVPHDGWDWDQPNRQFAAALNEKGIAQIDLLNSFREVGAAQRLYKPRDTHWNIAGNALAARMIAGSLLPILPAGEMEKD